MRNCRTYHTSILPLHPISVFTMVAMLFLLIGCAQTKHLAEGETLVHRVKVISTNPKVKPGEYNNNIRQNANTRWLGIAKVPLGIYNLSGRDTSRRWNKFVRRIGEAPVAYDSSLTDFSRRALTQALRDNGYLHAVCLSDTTTKERKTTVTYTMNPGDRYYVSRVKYAFDNDTIRQVVMADSANFTLKAGMPLSVSALYDERSRIIKHLRNNGYYRLNNEYISFTADTLSYSTGVILTLHFARPMGMVQTDDYQVYTISSVSLNENVQPEDSSTLFSHYQGVDYQHSGPIKIYRRVYDRMLNIRPDSIYRESDIQSTHNKLGALSAVKFGTVRLTPSADTPHALDAQVMVETNKPHSLSLDLEGTNTSGDLGAAVVFGYANNNIFRGSEQLSIRLRGAYEAIRGLEGYSNQDYIEYSGEANLQFPTFMIPGLSAKRRMNLNASSNLSLMFNSQDRPEFHRRLLTAGWGYKWNNVNQPRLRHRFDLLSLNYVFMPWISETFQQEYLEGDDPRYAVLRYSYENLLIMRTGYHLTYNSQNHQTAASSTPTGGYQVKMGIETAGNVLYGLSHLLKSTPNEDGQYSIGGIAYSQYAKFDFDYAKSFVLDKRSSLAMHAAFGIAIPYGNSTIIPYEKRYFSGGANSVRGWSVRSLGPGGFRGEDGKIDFINHTGNVKLDLSIEFRTHLFWKLHGAAFIDAGNIWNTHTSAPQGQFRWNTFYRELAASYGLGLRLTFDYFVIRLDGGMKAVNPSYTGRDQFPIIHPKFSRDFALHFAVGLPF